MIEAGFDFCGRNRHSMRLPNTATGDKGPKVGPASSHAQFSAHQAHWDMLIFFAFPVHVRPCQASLEAESR